MLAWCGDAASLARAATRLPYTADSYAPDLSVQAGHLLDSQGQFEEGVRFYRASLARDPYANPTWLLVALAEERLGHPSEADRAYQQAFHYEPSRLESYWMFANFLLRQSRFSETLGLLGQLLERSRSFDDAVFATAAHIASSSEIETLLLPRSGAADLSYLHFVLSRADSEAAIRAWKRLHGRYAQIRASEMDSYCRLLARTGQYELSWQGWRDWANSRGLPEPRADSVSNGSFETEPLESPYDWKFYSNRALHAFRDTSNFHSPKASAQMLFFGTENFEGVALEHWIRVEPGQSYEISFYWRSYNVTTDRPPAIEIWQIGRHPRLLASTDTEQGTWPWRHQALRFSSPTPIVRVAVRRSRSNKLGNRISGKFWLDDVQLQRL